MRPVDFELEPSRHSPQPLAVVKTLKQRDREARRGRGRPPTKPEPPHPDPRYRKPPEPVTRIVPLLDAAYVRRMREYLATGKSASGISLSGISVPVRQQLTGWITR